MLTVATHTGTATDTIVSILRALNARVKIISKHEASLAEEFDALLLLGGNDIMPFFYGEKNRFGRNFHRKRDLVELTLVRRALADGKPIMGICRGHQMIAVAAGGSLYQDITLEAQRLHHHIHMLKIDKPLDKYVPTASVNSLHHQAVKTVPHGFQVVARSMDSIIESIWRPGILGVQWHPELLYAQDQRWIKLFEWFVEGLG